MTAQLEKMKPTERRVRAYFRKTEFCRFFEAGRCLRGDECDFAHGGNELKTTPDLTKTAMCKAWAQGQCNLPRGQCAFAHGKDELRNSRDEFRKSQFNLMINDGWDSMDQLERRPNTPPHSPQGQGEMMNNAAFMDYPPLDVQSKDELIKDAFIKDGLIKGARLIKDLRPPNMACKTSDTKFEAAQFETIKTKRPILMPLKNEIKAEKTNGGPMRPYGTKQFSDLVMAQPMAAKSDFLLSPAMFLALPALAQQALLSTSMVCLTEARTNMTAKINKAALCRKLIESMPDHYDD